jgi:hypothetical protein
MLNEGNGGYNRLGLLLALMALSEFATRPLPARDAEILEKDSFKSSTHAESAGWLVPALSLGSLLFCLHNVLADSSTLIAWSWTGFTNGRANGPVPNIHSSLTLIAQSLGLLIAIVLNELPLLGNRVIRRLLWVVYGIASCSVSYQYRNWLGYLGGLNFAFFLMSAIPLILQSAAQTGSAGNTYFTAWVLYCLLSLANVWTVAYAFVPGGVYLRERTDL